MPITFTVAVGLQITSITLIFISFLLSAMSELGAGSKVWVKVANATIWWPSTVISTSSANTNSDVILNDPFSSVGIDDLILVKFLGTFDESVDNRIAALKLSDRGSSWECIGPADHRSQIVPTSLRMLYDSAIFMLEGNENLNLTLNPSNRFDSISMETPVKVKKYSSKRIHLNSASFYTSYKLFKIDSSSKKK